MDEKKKGLLRMLSFSRKDGKKKKQIKCLEIEQSVGQEQAESDETPKTRQGCHPIEDEGGSKSRPTTPAKKKKSLSLVRTLSFNKLRTPKHEARHRPEGGDSSRSLSPSSPQSPHRTSSRSFGKLKIEKSFSASVPNIVVGEQKGTEAKKEESTTPGSKVKTVTEKSLCTVSVVQYKPSMTFTKTFEKQDCDQKCKESVEVQCRVSTLPYAISKWSESPKKRIFNSESTLPRAGPSTDIEPRRRHPILQKQRDAVQGYYGFETLTPSLLGPTKKDQAGARKKILRLISVQKFDTLSEFAIAHDVNSSLGYIDECDGILTETYIQPRDILTLQQGTMSQGTSDKEKIEAPNQEIAASQTNTPSSGVAEKREHLYKILVIGELGSGKTSIIKRYVHQFFSQHYRATIGVDFALKVLNWDPHTIIRLQLWDIAGQERFGNMTRVYYKEAVGAFIVFDVTRSATLEAVVKWKQDLDSKVQLPDGSPIPCVLLANKCDQQKEGIVNSPSKMNEYCKEKNFAGWFETSAKENINIEEATRFLVNEILANDQIMKRNGSHDQVDGERFALNQPQSSTKKLCSC